MPGASKRRARRELVALGEEWFEPTEEQRRQVRMYRFNGMPEERIAGALRITLNQLRQLFKREMEYGDDELLMHSASRMVELAAQTEDLGVAFRANELILQSRSKRWRVPKTDDAPDTGRKAISKMTLAEVDARLAELRGAGRDPAAGAQKAAAGEQD